jgi:hypothetical protein
MGRNPMGGHSVEGGCYLGIRRQQQPHRRIYHDFISAGAGFLYCLYVCLADPSPAGNVNPLYGRCRREDRIARWATTEETNSDRFDIERSANGKQWSRIASVASQGDSKVLVNYSHVDASPLAGQNFYRLKMVDRGADGQDGMFAYSQIRNVSFKGEGGVAPYPNPAVDKILIRDHQLVKQIDIVNTSGVKVIKNQQPSSAGIDVTKLPQGIYIITMSLFDGTISTHKIAVTR